MCLSMLEFFFPSFRCTIFYLGLFFKCIEAWLNIFGYFYYVKKKHSLVKYSFINFAVSQLWAVRAWALGIGQGEGGGGGQDWGSLLPPPTAVENVIG